MKALLGLLYGLLFFTGYAHSQGFEHSRHAAPDHFINRLDKDGDGKVSESEFDGPGHHFNHLDKNGDGFLSESEAPKGPPGGSGSMKRSSGSTEMGRKKSSSLVDNSGREMQQQSWDKGIQNDKKSRLLDVHGAGAQRSDPKSGDPDKYSSGHGPQGDVVRVFNYARCVRGGEKIRDQVAKSFQVVDTAQNECYDNGSQGRLRQCPKSGRAYFGQDAQYRGVQPHYLDNGDGTVTDKVTGLTWQKTFSKTSWSQAFSAAKSAEIGGYTDWRVPTIKELYSLIKFNGATGTAQPGSSKAPRDAVPYLDTKVFEFEYPANARYIDAQYISSTSYVSKVMQNQDAFFGVNFADGRIKGYPKLGNQSRREFYVRFVRGNTEYGKNIFRNNGDGTIWDQATGLTWMKVDSGTPQLKSKLKAFTKKDGSLNWGEALQFCENLEYAGHADWRLPNAKELQSIVDYTRSPETTDSAAIDPVFWATAVKDEEGSTNYPFYWTGTTHLDGRNLGKWAVYVSFGDAHGYFNRQQESDQRRPKRKKRR